MKTIFAKEHPELRVTMYRDAIYVTHPEDDSELYNKTEISLREVDSTSLNNVNGEEFYCDSVEIIEVPGAGIKVNINREGKFSQTEFYGIRRYNNNPANIYVNGEAFLLTEGFL